MKLIRSLRGTLVYIALVLLTATLLIIASGASPLSAYQTFFHGIFGNLNSFCEVFVKGTPLILTGLACAVAFRTGFFNIGAEGQFYMGAVAAAAVALRCTFLPAPARVVLAFAAGFLAGGLWSLIAAGMKPGPEIGRVLDEMLRDVVNVPGHNTKAFLMEKYLPVSAADQA